MELLDLGEEKRIRNQLRDEAAEKCSDQKAKFGQCVSSAKIATVIWCRKELSSWNECLKSFNTEDELNRRINETIAEKHQNYQNKIAKQK